MPMVIDASVTLAWCFADEATPIANAVLRRLGRTPAMAPAIWPLEVVNGLRSAERRGRIDEEDIPALAALLRALPVTVEPVRMEHAIGSVLTTARALGLSAYDAAYLDLALRRRAPLATVDEDLARAAVAAGVELFTARLG